MFINVINFKKYFLNEFREIYSLFFISFDKFFMNFSLTFESVLKISSQFFIILLNFYKIIHYFLRIFTPHLFCIKILHKFLIILNIIQTICF